MISPIPPGAERKAYLELIETLQAELAIAHALNSNMKIGMDTLMADLNVLRAELRRWHSDAMTDHEARTLGIEHTPAGLMVRI